MPFFVCTLFEKQYHYGVAALLNSLYLNNYRGAVFAGYKGSLPAWCASSKKDPKVLWEEATTLEIAEDFRVHFLPVKDDLHLTFYKPYFMLALFKMEGDNADGIVYFDPDIVIKSRWSAFEAWMSHGVALVQESVNMPATHPFRGEWEKVIHTTNRQTIRSLHAYINGGFCGVGRQNVEFLMVWKEMIEITTKHFNLAPTRWKQVGYRTHPFFNADQDILNIAAMCCHSSISESGLDGMDLIPGGSVMSHALGSPKPWKKKFIRSALRGIGPRLADKGFWQYSTGPVQLYKKTFLTIKWIKISISSFISRFYKRS